MTRTSLLHSKEDGSLPVSTILVDHLQCKSSRFFEALGVFMILQFFPGDP